MNTNTDLQAFPIFRTGTHAPMHGKAIGRVLAGQSKYRLTDQKPAWRRM